MGSLSHPVWGLRNQDLERKRVQACTPRARGRVLCSASVEPLGQASQGQSWCPHLTWVLKPLSFILSSLARLAYQVVKVKPHDKDAKMKYQECNKIVKQKAFERAIAGDEHKRSVVDSLDIESMSESDPGAPLRRACRGTSGPRAHALSVLLDPPWSRVGAGGLVRASCLAVSVPQSHPHVTGLICP